ncbi:MAG: cysteine desulfurase [Acidimicrobiaceae bacterium]|nr:cysteine desulfurase [Acidimicrobiaceae bacterium]
MTTTGPTSVIYLDHNATTPVAPEVLDAMEPYLTKFFGNPSSDHSLGHEARRAVEEARGQVAALIGATPDEIVFTSGGTESNHLAIRGAVVSVSPSRRRVVTTSVEHPATAGACAILETQGFRITRLPVTREGIVDAEVAVNEIGEDVALVTIMMAQNETGAIMPVCEIAAIARLHGALVHSDAAQAVGKIEVNVDHLGVDLLSIAGHKLYAAKGVGALYIRSGTTIEPLTLGGGQERGLRPGSENVAGIVGLGVAATLAGSRIAADSQSICVLREQLWSGLVERIHGIVRHTPMQSSLPNTLLLSFPEVLGRDVLARAEGVLASTGSACHSGVDTPGATLLAMGVTPNVALGAVRLSLGRESTHEQIAAAIEILVTAFDVGRQRY